ncbi:MAG: peptidylprolyl isomerase [Bacteroidota bacterium]|nr:peptidylprolyl isomerase [Bacteroidota bacterium]
MQSPSRHHLIAISLPVVLLGLLVIAKWPKDPVLASADQLRITEADFRQAYTQWLLTAGVPDASQRRVAFIKDLAATRLLIQEARSGGIEDEPHYQDRRERLSRKLLIEFYAERNVLDTISVSDAEARQVFMRAQTQVTASHLYARTKSEAEKLYAELTSGADWDSLARQVFRDPKLQQSGGQLPPFSFDETDPGFEETAFTLPVGTYSHPIRTAQGYSIIRVDDRFSHPLLIESDYAAKRPLYEAYVKDRKRKAARRDYLLDLVDDAGIVFHEITVHNLLDRILHGAASESDQLWEAVLLEAAHPPMVWTVGDFREQARFTSDRQRGQVRTAEDLKEFVCGLVAGAIILEAARSLKHEPEYQDRLREALDAYIVDHKRRMLDVEIAEHDIKEYYRDAPASEFMWPAQVQLHWQVPASDESAHRAAWFDRAQLGAWADEAFEAAEGMLLRPIETPRGPVSVRVGPRRPERRQTLEEAHAAIETMLRHQRVRKERIALYDSLAARHHLIIYEDPVTQLDLDL